MSITTAVGEISHVTYFIEGRYVVAVETSSLEEAMKLAEMAYVRADFGDLRNISGELIRVKDAHGTCLWQCDSDNVRRNLHQSRVSLTSPSKGKSEFNVIYKIKGSYTVNINNKNLEEAKQEAEAVYLDANCGELYNIESEFVSFEDKYHNRIWTSDDKN